MKPVKILPKSRHTIQRLKLVDDPAVDLVIVATPPNSHADLSLQMMAGGKHVVCEKPLALNQRETDAMVEMAAR